MEKFKDFLYDKNDILIAFAVLAIAGLIIMWRMDVIMDYPDKILSDESQTVITNEEDKDADKDADADADKDKDSESDKDTDKDKDAEADKDADKDSDADSDKDSDKNSAADNDSDKDSDADKDKETDEPEAETKPLWSNGAITREVTVNVYGNSAYDAIGCLVSAGLFKDYDEYMDICKDEGFNHEKVSGGTFIFEKGTTKKEIVDRVNWS